jgi:hypothetical protein
VDRSPRRLGQLLVVMGALFGAVLGVSLALIVDNAQTSNAVAGPGRERAAVVAPATSPTSSTPPASQAASSGTAPEGNDSSGRQRAESDDRADKRNEKADKNGEGRRDKADGRKDKPGKGQAKGK